MPSTSMATRIRVDAGRYLGDYGNPLIAWGWGDPLPQGVVDASAGLGDALLLGFGDDIGSYFGINGVVDQSLISYRVESYGALAAGGVRIAYGGVVKGYSYMAPPGAAASAFRQKAKGWFRFGIGRKWRPPSLSKYSSDAALRAAAGRTNPYVNAYGAGVTAARAGEFRLRFCYSGDYFVVAEPFGDNSRYWIGPEESPSHDTARKVRALEGIFQSYTPPFLLKALGDLVTFKFFQTGDTK